jgi:hypothetical protein
MIPENLTQIKEKGKGMKEEIKQRTVGYITAALGLVAGLAWNEAIKSLIEYFFPMNQNNVLAKFIYAFVVTAVVVIITIYLIKLLGKKEK